MLRLWINTLCWVEIVRQVAVKYYLCNIVARKMCNGKLVIQLYVFVNQKWINTIVRKGWREQLYCIWLYYSNLVERSGRLWADQWLWCCFVFLHLDLHFVCFGVSEDLTASMFGVTELVQEGAEPVQSPCKSPRNRPHGFVTNKTKTLKNAFLLSPSTQQ